MNVTPMSASTAENSQESLNWTAITALYAALILGIGGALYWGKYRNAAWLVLLGTGGAFTAYGRVLANRGAEQEAERWKWFGGLVYAGFFLWAGTVLLTTLLGR